MKTITRRRFVAYAGSLLAFAPVIKSLTFDRAFAAVQGTDPFPRLSQPVVAEKYLGGIVADVSDTQIVAKTQDGLVTVALPGAEGIWKGGWATGEPIDSGDDFHAWGERIGPDRYTAEKIHFNIRNLTGSVSGLVGDASSPSRFTLLGTRAGIVDIAMTPKSRVVLDNDEVPITSTDPIVDGEVIQVLGVSRGNVVDAILIYRSY